MDAEFLSPSDSQGHELDLVICKSLSIPSFHMMDLLFFHALASPLTQTHTRAPVKAWFKSLIPNIVTSFIPKHLVSFKL